MDVSPLSLVVFVCLLHDFQAAPFSSASEAIAAVNVNVDFNSIHLENLLDDSANKEELKKLKFANSDELLSPEQLEYEDNSDAQKVSGGRKKRALLQRKHKKIWSDKIVPYVIGPTFSKRQKQMIKDCMSAIERVSCIKYEEHIFPNFPSKSFVKIVGSLEGCWSTVGMNSDNVISLNTSKCLERGVVLHELMHILGFYHEQSRDDRDKFVKVIWKNIKEDKLGEFRKRKDVESLGEKYDVMSLMHYHSLAFSKNGKPTLENLKGTCKRMGGNRLRRSDIKQLNLLYSCPTRW